MAEIYTYRNGEKVKLSKHSSQFVARDLPENLKKKGYPATAQLSSASSLVVCKEDELESMMTALRQSTICHHLYVMEDDIRQFLITDRLFLKFKESCDATVMKNLIEGKHLEVLREYDDHFFLIKITTKTGANPIKVLVDLVENYGELLAEADHDLNYVTYRTAIQLPTDSSYRSQWHLHQNNNTSDVDKRSSSNCEAAWKELDNFGAREVVIAISDDGCDMGHQDFGTNKFAGWAYLEGINLRKNTDRGAKISKMYQSGLNHGTACAGVAAAQVNNRMTVGAAPNCRLLPIKWETGEDGRMFVSDAKLVEIINYVGEKADVMSNSWSDSPVNSRSVQVTTLLNQFKDKGGRRDKGIVFLWSAGNNNCPIHHTADVEVPFSAGLYWFEGATYWLVSKSKTFFNSLTYLEGVLLVGAISSLAKRSHYSNYGLGLSVCAPSSNQHVYNRMELRGKSITTTLGGNTTRTDFGGTSASTPLVAGIVALVVSANPHLTAIEVVKIIKRTASKNLNFEGYIKTPYDPNWDTNQRGWDISPVFPFEKGNFQNLNHPNGTWSPWFGYGKVDALAAVKEAIRQLPGPRDTTPTSEPGIFVFREFHVSGIAHFTSSGDRTIRGGLALARNSSQVLTGFSLNIVGEASFELWYEATMNDGHRTDWVREGTFIGSRGGARIESIAIRLQGRKSERYSVNYRVLSRAFGLSAPCRDGAICSVGTGNGMAAFTVNIRRNQQA